MSDKKQMVLTVKKRRLLQLGLEADIEAKLTLMKRMDIQVLELEEEIERTQERKLKGAADLKEIIISGKKNGLETEGLIPDDVLELIDTLEPGA